MNSYEFSLNASWWWYILLISLSILFTIYTYRFTVPPVSKSKKLLLMSLRSLGLALLLFIIFEPLISIVSGKEIEPKLAVLLDNSISTALTDASGNRKELFRTAINNSGFTTLDNEQIEVTLFDSEIKNVLEFNLNQLDNKGQITNISKALKEVMKKSESENIQAVLLISDGAYNSGNNPIYDAEILGKPVFTIGIGDSIEPKDVSVQSLLTNDVVYVDNPVPVNVNINSSGYKTGELNLILYDNDQKIGEQNFKINPEMEDFTAVFEFAPKIEGVHKLTAKLNNLKEEITLKNNKKSEYVDVLKNKRKISIFAGAPSADVSFVKNALSDEKGVSVKTFVQKDNNSFYNNNPDDKDFKETEVFILIGYPINSSPPSILTSIKNELEKGKSIFLIASKFINYNSLRIIDDFLPFTTTSSKQNEFLTTTDINPTALGNPLLRITGSKEDLSLWNKLPPVFHTETFVSVKPESEILSTMKINNVPLKEPLILSRSIRNKKSAVFMGYDIYRWKLLGYAADVAKGKTDTPDLFTLFIQNTVKWLSIDIKNKLVEIKTTKKFYANTEKVEFFAQVYDQSYNPIENATVNVIVRGGSEANKEIILNSLGNGRYHGKIEGLQEGGYYFSGDAISNGRKIGSDNDRFSVGEIAVEYSNLTMNAGLLRSLANNTGAKFYMPENAGDFLKDLKSTKSFKAVGLTLHSEIVLWNLPWIVIMSILCFSFEWFLRKRAGML